jgi:hypothetical protein
MESAMRVRSPVTTGAWWRTAVVMTMVSTTSAVREWGAGAAGALAVREYGSEEDRNRTEC